MREKHPERPAQQTGSRTAGWKVTADWERGSGGAGKGHLDHDRHPNDSPMARPVPARGNTLEPSTPPPWGCHPGADTRRQGRGKGDTVQGWRWPGAAQTRWTAQAPQAPPP